MAYNVEINGLQIKNAEGKNVIGSDFKVEIKELDTYKRTFWAIASEESPDRDKDIIRVAGWNLKNYIKAPRGLWMHDYFEHPHFKTLEIKKDKKDLRLLFQPQFDTHDRATMTFNQFANGFLDDFSVGFMPGEFAWNNENDMWGGGRDFQKGHELLEISAVTVPAHPNAQMLRSAGLLPKDQINLNTLGYKDNFYFKKEDNCYWYPILLDMSAYKTPKTIKLGKGITVVKALPRFSEESELVIGYFFDRDVFNTEKSITEWINSQLLVKPTMKFYQIGFNEEKNELDITITNQEVDITIKVEEEDTSVIEIEEEKDLTTSDVPENLLEQDSLVCSCETFEASEEDGDKCKGCGGKKPKKAADDEEEEDPKKPDEDEGDDKSVNNSIEEKGLSEDQEKNILQLFDKAYENKVKGIVTELDAVKAELGEIKGLFAAFMETLKGLETLSEEKLLDLSELDLSLVPSPVSKDEDDSEGIQIDSETFNQLSKDAVISNVGEMFKKVFEAEKDKLSGKLD